MVNIMNITYGNKPMVPQTGWAKYP